MNSRYGDKFPFFFFFFFSLRLKFWWICGVWIISNSVDLACVVCGSCKNLWSMKIKKLTLDEKKEKLSLNCMYFEGKKIMMKNSKRKFSILMFMFMSLNLLLASSLT
jgi:hypothetical protein